ncbi:hypothetical protein [Haloechinothrix sp. LS1_15]|uniref:hypothetical protein n=1 Tax=Haloechinothrix sp. LS1_15 TaxID=2652248 RepID=UPI002948A107|nr:hypothetical protein [Haloechinothrix sp. LS1_15]MDV6011079.1 hypothetical protein [Haloechinothrix sp. LS1_15]
MSAVTGHGQPRRTRSDGTYLIEASVARGLGFVLVANDAVFVGQAGGPAELCVAQGVGPGTTQASAALAREPDTLRAMLADRQVPVPETRTLRFSDGADAAVAAAGQLGYPVAVRPVWGIRRPDAPALAFPADDEESLRAALAALAAAFDTGDAEFERVRGRYLVEHVPARCETRALVVAGRCVAGVSRPATGAMARDGACRAIAPHRWLRQVVEHAADAVDGLDVATVTVAVDDPEQSVRRQPHAVTAIEPHPRLGLFDQADPGTGATLAHAILERYARQAGISVGSGRAEQDVELTIAGLDSGRDGELLAGAMPAHRVVATERRWDASGTQCTVAVRATPAALADLAAELMHGSVGELRPRFVAGMPR